MNYLLEILAKVGFDWKMGLFSLINFLILFWLLKKLFFESIVKGLNKRSVEIKEGVENMQKAKTELQMAEQRAQGLVDQAKVDASKIMEKSAEQAKELKEQMKDKAKSEIELLVVQAKRNIEIDREEMRDSIRRETVELIIKAVGKIVEDKMDPKKDKTYIDEILQSLK